MKKLLKIFVITIVSLCGCFVWAQDISIMPEWSDVWDIVRSIATWGKVRDNYREQAEHWNLTIWDQFASWVMSWDTILDYCVYLAKFLWELALLAWALVLIYLWYDKIWKAIKPEWTTPFAKVVLWLVVVIFAYAIIKFLRAAFIS